MAKFVVIDPTLRGVGQHHFEYDVHVLSAAERNGWQAMLAAHRDFDAVGGRTGNWQIHRAFGDDRHRPVLHKLRQSQRRLAAATADGGSLSLARQCEAQINGWRYGRRHDRATRGYRAALDATWTACQPTPGDQIFVPTVTPADLVGLADWAPRNRAACKVDWHLQFHFPLVDAATWYARESRKYDDQLLDLPDALADLLAALPRDRVHLYATTRSLADQFGYCLGESFTVLPIPVNSQIAACRAAIAEKAPLRAICAGQARSEKGASQWGQIVEGLKDDYFARGRLQVALQAASEEELPAPLRRLSAEFGMAVAAPQANGPIALAGWPLGPREYVEYLASADIGLLTYDPLAYHYRISGVMVELLGAGVPVVVPAGCALADELAESIFAYQQQLREHIPVVANHSTAELDWRAARPHGARPGISVGSDATGAK
ncbi:MAG TPA: hypothetical protein VMF30_00730, partial [Pirellulales bacterium]|nr:hypothetical protein [Pirellulales bacterium]